MRLLIYESNEGPALGIKLDARILDVQSVARDLGMDAVASTPVEFYAQGQTALPALASLVERSEAEAASAGWLMDEDELTLSPCVHSPEKVLCVGLNYRRHAAESGAQVPEFPVIFSKFNNALTGHKALVPLPANIKEYDYEVELAVVIGKRGKYIPESVALDYVLGYTNANDLSARDLQSRTSQWLIGKTLDGSCPIGPYLVTADEVGDPQALVTRSWLNGELRQNSNTADMVFSVAEVISYISHIMTLEPGDVILTGTPEGVILGMDPKVWMKPGDVVSVEVGNFGKLTNTLIAE
jgi:2-keto-4-pentenoate hydratase/2-oxohepta-3-ene-1,7-dioic acid hydratase in catechol pathway